MSKVIAVCNQKGGVGKTVTTVNLGIGLAKKGRRVLLIDMDAQGCTPFGKRHSFLQHNGGKETAGRNTGSDCA